MASLQSIRILERVTLPGGEELQRIAGPKGLQSIVHADLRAGQVRGLVRSFTCFTYASPVGDAAYRYCASWAPASTVRARFRRMAQALKAGEAGLDW